MGRNLDPKCKQCRREGKKLFLKGERCFSPKCAMIRKAYPPGQHGQTRRRGLSEYGIQLREKQKVRRIYGLMEKQFRKYFDQASRMKGEVGSVFLSLLERRLDNVVYRLGFASSRNLARQLVNHGHFLVNGKKIDIPSYSVKEGDVISIKNKKMSAFSELENTLKNYQFPAWLLMDLKKMEGKMLSVPIRQEIDLAADTQLIVEYYSR
jgi:small subunit ribosomal protein S4